MIILSIKNTPYSPWRSSDLLPVEKFEVNRDVNPPIYSTRFRCVCIYSLYQGQRPINILRRDLITNRNEFSLSELSIILFMTHIECRISFSSLIRFLSLFDRIIISIPTPYIAQAEVINRNLKNSYYIIISLVVWLIMFNNNEKYYIIVDSLKNYPIEMNNEIHIIINIILIENRLYQLVIQRGKNVFFFKFYFNK